MEQFKAMFENAGYHVHPPITIQGRNVLLYYRCPKCNSHLVVVQNPKLKECIDTHILSLNSMVSSLELSTSKYSEPWLRTLVPSTCPECLHTIHLENHMFCFSRDYREMYIYIPGEGPVSAMEALFPNKEPDPTQDVPFPIKKRNDLFIDCCRQHKNADLHIEKVVYNGPATIMFWNDGTKTIAKKYKNDFADDEKAAMVCILKKVLGDDKFKKLMREREQNEEFYIGKVLLNPQKEGNKKNEREH